MNNFIFENRTKVVFGRGCVKEYLADFLDPYGPRILLANGSGSVKRSGVYDEIFRILRLSGKEVTEFPDISPSPTYSKVLEGAQLVRENGVNLILAVGGNAVLDCCKAVSMAAAYRGDLWADFWAQQGVVDFQPVPLGAVVTTACAGSGMNGRAVLTNEKEGVKCGRNYPRCAPAFSLMDPAYACTVPRMKLASSGFGTFCQLLESYFCPPDTENVSDDLMEALMRGIIRDLRIAVNAPEDYRAQSNLMWEAVLSGNCLIKLGKQADFPCHYVARQLEARTGCPYGACLAVLVPALYRRACEHQPDKFARFARNVWGILPEGRTEAAVARAGIDALASFAAELRLPASLRELGISQAEMLEGLAAACSLPARCSLPLDPGALQDILRECY